MENVKVNKGDIVVVLKKNRDEHRTIFLSAVEGYRKRAIEILEENIAIIKKGKLERLYVTLPVPEDHTKDYDRAIKMLEMSVDLEIELSEKDFKQYVLDDWSWQQDFLASNTAYTVMAQNKLDDMES